MNYDAPTNVDLVIVPSIDGHFDTSVAELESFEKEFQTYFSLWNFVLVSLYLAAGLTLPDVDTDVLRHKRGDFCHRFCERPYFLIRAKTPQIVWDEVEKVL